MNIFLTGCCGFIGFSVTQDLLKNKNINVIGLDNINNYYSKNLKKKRLSLLKKNKNFKFLKIDLNNFNKLKKKLKNQNIKYIIHLAAQPGVRISIKNPYNTLTQNLSAFSSIIDIARLKKVKKFIYASSSSVYGDTKYKIKKENKLGNPLSPYAVTKVNNESYAKIYAKLYNMKIIGLRYFNVFGSNQDQNSIYSAVIPKWIRLMKNEEVVPIFGDGKNSRDFCYIDNVIQANILAAFSKNTKHNVYNVAYGGRTSLEELIEKIYVTSSSMLDGLKVKKIYQDPRIGDVMHSMADISKIKKDLNYSPTHSVDEGLKETIKWYLNNRKKNDS